jgi:hypothetical protein
MWLLFASFLCLFILLWRSTRPIQPHTRETRLLVIYIYIYIYLFIY